MPILELEGVTYRYKNKYQSVEAVKNVNYEFERGKVYAIVGKSGSGKTTLLSLMAGLALPGEGQVYYNGRSTKDMDRDRYRRDEVAVIYQTFNLFPMLNVLENVMYPLQLRGIGGQQAKERAKEMIAAVGLTDVVYRRYPAMLSGGERQRVAIARALAADVKIIFADEPTGNLDVENSDRVIDLLFDLCHKRGYCVIVVTHDPDIAGKADVVIRMQDGCLAGETLNRNGQ